MARKYQEVWNLLAKRESATLICLNNPHTIKAIKDAIYKEKHHNNERRRALGIPGFGRISISVVPFPGDGKKVKLLVSLAYSGDSL